MDPERWQRCKQIFQAALDLPRADRAAYVRDACQGDEDLRSEIVSLLESEEQSNEFLSRAAADYLASSPADQVVPDGRLAAGEVLAGRYQIARLLGRGGMGEVYEAEDLELHATVALKLVRPEIAAQPELVDRFKREVLLARQVTHPNVCRIFDLGYHRAGAAGRIIFLTMEMLAGETLADRLARTGPLRTAEALPLVRQLVAGLAAAHRAGIIHRDFKCANVILVPEEDSSAEDPGLRVKIMDFGLARAVSGSDSARTTLTVAGLMVGTPAYMAPEQIEGGEITAATDIYALGVVMYEMVTGVLPFVGDSPWIVATKRLRQAPPSPRTHVADLDRNWETVILRCLERSPNARYANASDVVKALAGEGGEPVRPAAPKPRRKPRPLILAAILVLLLASAAAYYILHTPGARPESGPSRFGWHRRTLPADASLSQVTFAASSLDPLKVLLFGPSFSRSWEPRQVVAPPLPMPFPVTDQAECQPGVWLIHDDHRHLTKWDADKQAPSTTIALPWPFTSAACLDDQATRWGFLSDESGSPRWIEFDVKAHKTIRTIPLDAHYVKAKIDPHRQSVALAGSSLVSIRDLDRFQEIFRDKLSETLIGRWDAAWSETGRYFAVGFKQLVIYDMAAKRRMHTLATAGWLSGIGWIGDNGLSAMDDRGRLYWTADLARDWQLREEPPTPGTYLAAWLGPQNRWLALNQTGQGQELVWDYIAPPLLLDLQVSPLEIWSVAASPDGSSLAVAGKDPRIFIVDLQQSKTVRTLEGHTDGVTFVRFQHTGRLISASDDKTLRLWDTRSGKLLKTVAGHESLVNAFAITPGDQWLVSVSSDNKIKLWRLPDLVFVKDIGATSNAGAAAAFLPNDSRHLLISDWKGRVYLYEGTPPDWSVRQEYQLNNNVVYMLCSSENAWWAIGLGGKGQGLWRVPASDLTKAARVSQGAPGYCATADDARLTAILYQNHMELRSNSDGKLAANYPFAAREGAAIAISSHPPTVIAGFGDGHLLAWPAPPPR